MIATDVASRGIGMIENYSQHLPLSPKRCMLHLLLLLAEMSLAIVHDLIRILLSNSVRFSCSIPGPRPGIDSWGWLFYISERCHSEQTSISSRSRVLASSIISERCSRLSHVELLSGNPAWKYRRRISWIYPAMTAIARRVTGAFRIMLSLQEDGSTSPISRMIADLNSLKRCS